MISATITVVATVFLLIFSTAARSLSQYKAENIFDIVKRQPDINEDSTVASGKIRRYNVTEDELECISTESTQLVFQSKRITKHCMTKKCHKALKVLTSHVAEYFKTECSLQLIRSFTSVKQIALRSNSLHYEGRALDLRLLEGSNETEDKCKHNLRQLAWLAKFGAKFDFVELKATHIHVSCQKDT